MNLPEVDSIVLVTWRDAWFDFEEPDPEAIRDDYLVTTVGWVIKADDKFLSLAAEELPDDDGYRAVTHIPVVLIQGWSALAAGGKPCVCSDTSDADGFGTALLRMGKLVNP